MLSVYSSDTFHVHTYNEYCDPSFDLAPVSTSVTGSYSRFGLIVYATTWQASYLRSPKKSIRISCIILNIASGSVPIVVTLILAYLSTFIGESGKRLEFRDDQMMLRATRQIFFVISRKNRQHKFTWL